MSDLEKGTDRVIPRRAVAAWILYDLANTVFSMGVVSLMFPLLVRESVGEDRADAVQGIVTAISMSLIFLLSPLLGAITDHRPRRMPFLVGATLVCIGLTFSLGRFGFLPSVIAFIFANAAFQAGVLFYDALLPEVSTPQNRGRIGGMGVGFGYVGSFIAIGITMVFEGRSAAFIFSLLGGLFLVTSWPCFIWVKERPKTNSEPITWALMKRLTAKTVATLRSARDYPGLGRFLLGRVFYTDSVNTVIMMMVLFTVNVAVANGADEAAGQTQSRLIMLFAIVFAIAGGLAWGWLVDRIGPKKTLSFVLSLWIVVFLLAAGIAFFRLPLWLMYGVGTGAGIGMGGMIAADRPLMLTLTPDERVGEFYGLYGMVGRFSAIVGPVLWAGILWITIEWFGVDALTGQGFGILVLLALVCVSVWILRPVSDGFERKG